MRLLNCIFAHACFSVTMVLSLTVLVIGNAQAQTAFQHSPLSPNLARALASPKIAEIYESAPPSIGPAVVSSALTCTPTPCALPNVQASQGGNPVTEDPIVVNPRNTLQLLTAGNDYNCPTLQGFYASGDGGSTWTRNCLASLFPFGGAGDPIVGYDRKLVAYAGGVDVRGKPLESVIVIAKSTNNGTAWSTPTLAVSPIFLGGLVDKPWLHIDTNGNSPRVNTLYISATQLDSAQSNTEITVSHSTDGGNTWVTVPVDTLQPAPVIEQYSNVTTGRDGSVYVSWLRCTISAGVCGATVAEMMFAKSTDGGNSWSAPLAMASVTLVPDTCNCAFYGNLPNSIQPASNIPAIGIDNSTGTHAGTLYSVMYNWTGTQMRVVVTHSTDHGTTWSAPVPVAPSTFTHDQFFPWLSVSGGGIVGVSWLDRRNDPSNIDYEAFGAVSTNGGTGFGTNRQLANAPSNPNNVGFCGTGTCFMGDKTGNTWAGNKLFTSWIDNRSGAAMQDFVGGLFQ